MINNPIAIAMAKKILLKGKHERAFKKYVHVIDGMAYACNGHAMLRWKTDKPDGWYTIGNDLSGRKGLTLFSVPLEVMEHLKNKGDDSVPKFEEMFKGTEEFYYHIHVDHITPELIPAAACAMGRFIISAKHCFILESAEQLFKKSAEDFQDLIRVEYKDSDMVGIITPFIVSSDAWQKPENKDI